MLLPQSSPVPGPERWSPVLDCLCLTPSKRHTRQAAAPAHTSAGRPCLLQAQTGPQGLLFCSLTPVPPHHPPRVCCATRKRAISAAPTEAVRDGAANTRLPWFRQRVQPSPRPRNKPPPTALGSGCSDRTPAASPDLQVHKDVLRTNSLRDRSFRGCVSLSWVGIATASPLIFKAQ